MWKNADLNVGDLTQTPEGRPGGSGGGGRDDVGSSADGLLASTAVPDANRVPLDGVLAAEGAVDLFVSLHFCDFEGATPPTARDYLLARFDIPCVPGVLADFHTLDLLPQGGTISVRMSESTRCALRIILLVCENGGDCISFVPSTVLAGDTDLCDVLATRKS